MERAPMFPGGFSKPASDVFPVSIKGVLYEGGRVVLLENERGEWELPGGRLEAGEAPESCLAREVEEELGMAPEIGPLLDCWVYEVLPKREVLIVTYGLDRRDSSALRVSAEHRRIGLFSLDQIDRIRLPRGYRRAIRAWAQLNDPQRPRFSPLEP
jgi:8-oxo-dGTP pyrophosphatase MutT (NUDIX family)